jgi:hypothetical protein
LASPFKEAIAVHHRVLGLAALSSLAWPPCSALLLTSLSFRHAARASFDRLGSGGAASRPFSSSMRSLSGNARAHHVPNLSRDSGDLFVDTPGSSVEDIKVSTPVSHHHRPSGGEPRDPACRCGPQALSSPFLQVVDFWHNVQEGWNLGFLLEVRTGSTALPTVSAL